MLADRLGRSLRSLRISVTDRCNLRCSYCMPEEEYTWLPKGDILSFEEIHELVRVFAALGVDRIRLTGGEPLLRRQLPTLVELIRAVEGIKDVALTTNGVRLPEHAADLAAAGLSRVTVSLDTLDAERYHELTRRKTLDKTLAGIRAAADAGFKGALKLNTVVIRGTNDDELVPLLELSREVGAELRFIEYMDVGGATQWSWDRVFDKAAILERLSAHYGEIEELSGRGSAPAGRFRLPDGHTFGVIASTTAPFCFACDRARVTADGTFYMCLYARDGLDLRTPVRDPGTTMEMTCKLVAGYWEARTDRGAEIRLGLRERRPLAVVDELKADPRLEMHKRGG